MATVQHAPKLRRKRQIAPPPTGEQRLRISFVDYPAYVAFVDSLVERHIRATFADGELELMTLSEEHEDLRTTLGLFVVMLGAELDMQVKAGGSMTFRRADLERGLEPDECYWIASLPLLQGRRVDLAKGPPPDLVIEVEISRSSLDRMDIYARLGVPEVWRHDGEVLHFEALNKKGSYEARGKSRSFPALRVTDANAALAGAVGISHSQQLRYFRDWIQGQVSKNWKS
jgi:Uma2 family endonuclease